MKSIRGSDPDAAIHYLARFLEVGDLPACCRRLLCSAAEDIGLAYPQAIAITKACVDSALQLGLPEARLPLAEAAILLATTPKSNSAHQLPIIAAMSDIEHGRVGQVPRHLQNVHAAQRGQRQGPRPTAIRTTIRTTMSASSTCPTRSRTRTITTTARTRPSRLRSVTGTRSRAALEYTASRARCRR